MGTAVRFPGGDGERAVQRVIDGHDHLSASHAIPWCQTRPY